MRLSLIHICGTVLELHSTILEATLTQNDLIREAHKIVVGKLKSGTLVTIIDDDLNTRCV